MAIEYIAYNEDGDRVVGTLAIESPERAQEALWASNLIILSLKKRRRGASLAELMPTLFGVKALDIITFTRELAALLDSGIALLPSLRVLHEQTDKQALKDAIRAVMQDIEAGIPFSQACARQPSVFSPFYTRLLEVAEETGELKKILLEIVAHVERQRAIAGKVRKALTYPAVVLGVGSVAAVILLTFALPALTGLLSEYGGDIPFTTRMLMGIGEFSQAYGMYVLVALGVLSLAGWQFSRTAQGKRVWDSIFLRIPIIGRITYHSQMSRLCSSLTTLLEGGLPTAEAIKLATEATDNTVFSEALSEVYREVLTGSRLEPAISRQKVFPRLFAQTIGIGEETGGLRVNLAGLSAFYEQETDRVASRATDMIEPVMILFIGSIVAFIGMAIVSAIYSIIPQIG